MSMPPGPPTDLPPAYYALLERLTMPLQLEALHRSLTRAFDLDATENAEYDEALLRVLLCVRLAPEGMLRAKDISEQVLKSTSHVSRLIDRAEASDLVERRPDLTDRRAHRIALTQRGETVIDEYVPHAVAMLDQAYGDALTPEEMRTVIDLLTRLEASALELVAAREAARNG